MNVTVENLAPCKKLVRIEIEAAKVDETFAAITKDFQKQAALPGFRPGKAPRDMVVKKYEADITEEAKRKLISEGYRKAIEEKKIEVLGYPDIEEIQFGKGQALQFAATVETAPEFELPSYAGLEAKLEARTVTDDDMNRAFDTLRQQQVTFNTVTRPAQTNDVAVVNYTGTSDGKPITDIAPTAKGLTEQKNFWVEMESNSFIPGFADQLLGAKAGDQRTVNVDFPADFVTPALQGKKGSYAVEVVEVKEKVLPPLDDAFAKSLGAENLEKLREGVRRDLENELSSSKNKSVRNQIIKSLLGRVNFELPESAVAQETKNVVYDIVRENQKRGVSRDLIEQQKEQIYSAAATGAKERVKIAFLLQKIAEKESIKVGQEEVAQRIGQMAAMYQIPPDKFIKDLQKRNGIVEIYDQLVNEKVVDYLQKNAKVEEVPAGTLAPA
ncbi:MAG: trigger factor [Verrucomicrobiota bacterium]